MLECEDKQSRSIFFVVFKEQGKVGNNNWKDMFNDFYLNNPKYIFIHSGHFYSAPSSPLLLRGAPDYSTDTVSEFHAEAHRQLHVKDLPKVPTWQLERESNPRPSG